MDEISVALQQSGVRFLWVVRGKVAWIEDTCASGGCGGLGTCFDFGGSKMIL